MASDKFPLRQSGIYRNLPSFDPDLQNLHAIVCGATGISGFHTMRALLDTPRRWSKIYAVSRSPFSPALLRVLTAEQQARIQHVSIDMTGPVDDIVQALLSSNVKADYLFFFSYLQPKTSQSAMDVAMAEALIETNVPMFDNFLQALSKTGNIPKRILLQTGGKNYGMHIGRVRTPLVESDPQPKHLQPNFYYEQERLLFEFCSNHPRTSWNVIRPAGVIGAVPNNPINTFSPFGIYAAVQAEKGDQVIFAGDLHEWQFEACHSTARLTGYLCEWAVLEEKCSNQAFNAHDGSPLSWDRFFEELARWFGADRGAKLPELDARKFHVTQMAGGKDAPLGYGPPLELKLSSSLADWARTPGNADAWRRIVQHSNGSIEVDPFASEDPNQWMGDFAFLAFGSLSMNKARRFGFTGFVDSLESIFEMYEEMATMGLLPKMKVAAPRPLI